MDQIVERVEEPAFVGRDQRDRIETFGAEGDFLLVGEHVQGFHHVVDHGGDAARREMGRGAEALDAVPDLAHAVLDAPGSVLEQADHPVAEHLAGLRAADPHGGQAAEELVQLGLQEFRAGDDRGEQVFDVVPDIAEEARHFGQLGGFEQARLLDGLRGQGGHDREHVDVVLVELPVSLVEDLEHADGLAFPALQRDRDHIHGLVSGGVVDAREMAGIPRDVADDGWLSGFEDRASHAQVPGDGSAAQLLGFLSDDIAEDQLLSFVVGQQHRAGVRINDFQSDAQCVLDQFVHVDVLREGLADEAGGLELALALEQSAVLLPSRRTAPVPEVPGVRRRWAPFTRHVCLSASLLVILYIPTPSIEASGPAGSMWSWREESNLQPAVYKTAALPLSYASAQGLALCMVAYFTTGYTTSPVSLRG